MSIADTAQSVLAAHGLAGRIDAVSGNLWVFRGLRGSRGVAVEIEGEPDEALLNEAAAGMVAALDDEPGHWCEPDAAGTGRT